MKHVTQTLKLLSLAGVLVLTQNQVIFGLAPESQGVTGAVEQAQENLENLTMRADTAGQTSFPKATAEALYAYWESFSGDSTNEKARNIRKAGTIDTRAKETGFREVCRELRLDETTITISPTEFITSPDMPFIATHKTEKTGNTITITPQIDKATVSLEPRIAHLRIFEAYEGLVALHLEKLGKHAPDPSEGVDIVSGYYAEVQANALLMATRHNPTALDEGVAGLQRLLDEGLIKKEHRAIAEGYLAALRWVLKNTALIQRFQFDPFSGKTLYDALEEASKAQGSPLKIGDLNKNLLSAIKVSYSA